MNLGLIALKVKRENGQANGRTSKSERLTAAERPLAGQIMSSLPIRDGTPKAGPAHKSAQAGILSVEPGSSGAGKGSGPAPAFNSRHKHLKYQ
jgi:hypothetical protein